MRRVQCDVVVVGARAAGAATAMLLARQGLDIVVVERGHHGADTLSTHALMRSGVLQLRRWGLLDAVTAAGTPPIRRASFVSDGTRLTIPVEPSHGVDALYAPRRTVLDPIVVDAAAAAGAELRYRTTVTDLRGNGARVTGVVARDPDGRRSAIDARLVVGADGMRSTVAGLVGAPFDRVGTGASGVLYGYWSDMATDGYEWIFRRHALAGVIPTNDGQTCIFAASTPERTRRGGLDTLRDIVAQADEDLGDRLEAATAPPGARRFAGQPGFVRRSWGPGWALVGDAGYWKDPLSAHGLTDAFRDAELLARAVVASIDGRHDEAEALAAYQATRDRLSADLFTTSDAIAAQTWTDAEIGGLLRRLSRSMDDELEALAALDALPAP